MAWTFEDKFNSDTKSTGDLNGQDGWSGSTAYDVVTSNCYEGDQCVMATSANANMDQTISAVSSGTVYVAMRKETQNRDALVDLRTSGSIYTRLQFNGSDILIYKDGGSDTVISGFTTSQYYVFEIQVDSTSSFKYRIHDGTSWSSQSGATTPIDSNSIEVVRMSMGSGSAPATGDMYWDIITPTNPVLEGVTFTPKVMMF